MCGRYARFSSVKTFAERFHAQGTLTLTESYNIAPTQAVLLARNAEDGWRELAALALGAHPSLVQRTKNSLLLYIERWLKALVRTSDGTLVSRERGTPQGAVVTRS